MFQTVAVRKLYLTFELVEISLVKCGKETNLKYACILRMEYCVFVSYKYGDDANL
jgi:hypothetical protein